MHVHVGFSYHTHGYSKNKPKQSLSIEFILMKVYIYLLQQFLDVENTVQSSKLVQYKLTEISSYKQLQESRDNLLQ